MQYLMINGSPRPHNSNSGQIIDNLILGLQKAHVSSIETVNLRTEKDRCKCAEMLSKVTHALIIFPLYIDAMPGIVMDFLEKLSPYQKSLHNLHIGFIVHSGFPETRHCLAIKKYLDRLPSLLGTRYMGCITFGGSMTLDDARKETIIQIGQLLAQNNAFDQDTAKKLTRFDHLPLYMVPLFKIIVRSKRMQHYWIDQLKKNDAYSQRNDMPYF